jgi:hypothetical protein
VTEAMGRNAVGTAIRIVPRPMVLDAVHGAAEALPQFWIVSVQEPTVWPTAVFGLTDALNCLTAFLALAPGAAKTIAIRTTNVMSSGKRARRDKCCEIPDILRHPLPGGPSGLPHMTKWPSMACRPRSVNRATRHHWRRI